jgi:hypothetical protein
MNDYSKSYLKQALIIHEEKTKDKMLNNVRHYIMTHVALYNASCQLIFRWRV